MYLFILFVSEFPGSQVTEIVVFQYALDHRSIVFQCLNAPSHFHQLGIQGSFHGHIFYHIIYPIIYPIICPISPYHKEN